MSRLRRGARRVDGVARTGVPLRLLVEEAVSGVTQRPTRSVLTALGTVLGIGAFVAVLGITSTANGQITRQFDALAATQVTVKQASDTGARTGLLFPPDAEQRVERLHGVAHAGVSWNVSNVAVSRFGPGLDDGLTLDEGQAPVVAASPGLWGVAEATLRAGRTFDGALADEAVAVIGETLAEELGLTDLVEQPVVFVAGRPFQVVGIVTRTERVDALESAVAIPSQVALQTFGPPSLPAEMTVETVLGAAESVAHDAPLALDPRFPDDFVGVAPIDPDTLQRNVSADLRGLFLALAAVCLCVGAVGIANANLVAVMERVPEIGLRRALGALPRHIGGQFLVESTILGGFGGVVGSAVGVTAVVAVSAARSWTPVVEPATVLLAPVLGGLVGLVAGLYPALRASRIEPVEAFRR